MRHKEFFHPIKFHKSSYDLRWENVLAPSLDSRSAYVRHLNRCQSSWTLKSTQSTLSWDTVNFLFFAALYTWTISLLHCWIRRPSVWLFFLRNMWVRCCTAKSEVDLLRSTLSTMVNVGGGGLAWWNVDMSKQWRWFLRTMKLCCAEIWSALSLLFLESAVVLCREVIEPDVALICVIVVIITIRNEPIECPHTFLLFTQHIDYRLESTQQNRTENEILRFSGKYRKYKLTKWISPRALLTQHSGRWRWRERYAGQCQINFLDSSYLEISEHA